jgi:uncharacterized protein (DUF1330 family)
MSKAYWIVAYRSISNPSAMQAYGGLALPAIEAHGGKLLVFSGDAIETHEAGLKELTVVIEFPSYAEAKAAYASDAYGVALKTLGDGAERDFRIVEGLA